MGAAEPRRLSPSFAAHWFLVWSRLCLLKASLLAGVCLFYFGFEVLELL